MNDKLLDISGVLGLLIKHANITEAELARKISIPRATINRLVSGKTPDPRASTLTTIAQYFNVTVDQLMGNQPLVWNNDSYYVPEPKNYIPILKWSDSTNWEVTLQNIKAHDKDYCWILIDQSIDQSKFGLRVNGESMWPQFPENTILIIDPTKKAVNRDFVIAYIKKDDVIVFRQLLAENKDRFLKAINSIFPPIELNENDRILGVIIQVRKDY